MSAYTDLFKRGCRGFHVFDAAALDVLTKYLPVDKPVDTPDGVVVDIIDKDTSEVLCSDILIHNNGRKDQAGEKAPPDSALDTLWFRTAQLAAMPDEVQDALYPYEQVPEGRREPKDGIDVIDVRPTEAALIEARRGLKNGV